MRFNGDTFMNAVKHLIDCEPIIVKQPEPIIILQQPIGEIEFKNIAELNTYLVSTYKIKLRM